MPVPRLYCIEFKRKRAKKKKGHIGLHNVIQLGHTRGDETEYKFPTPCGWCGSNQNRCTIARDRLKHKKIYKCVRNGVPRRKNKDRFSGEVNKPVVCNVATCKKKVQTPENLRIVS